MFTFEFSFFKVEAIYVIVELMMEFLAKILTYLSIKERKIYLSVQSLKC